MTNRVIKYETFILSIIALIPLASILFEKRADSYLSIGQAGESQSQIAYFISSFFQGGRYYIGFWLIPCLLLLFILCKKVFLQRNEKRDILSFHYILISGFACFLWLAPSLQPKALYDLNGLPFPAVMAFLGACLGCLTYLFIREQSFEQAYIGMREQFTHYKSSFESLPIISKWKRLKGKKQEDILYEEETEYIEEVVEEPRLKLVPELSEDLVSEEKEDSELVVEQNLEQVVQEPQEIKVKVVKKMKKGAFFKSEDLIRTLEQENPASVSNPDQKYFDDIIQCLEEKLAEFKIEANVINILKGPVVDTFELDLGAGVRVSKVTSIQDDLSLALSGAPIRMVYPMKGKTTIGVEVPRNPREIILLDEVLRSQEFLKSRYRLPICMGKDAFGDPAIVDLAKMPHMLVAGATGAGKSVFVNTLLVSLLVRQAPSRMRLILIDPKQLELAQYAKLPHLCLPVVTEPKQASISLLWAVEEMERRYTILKEMGVRNIEGFNEKLQRATPSDLAKIHQYYVDPDDQGYEMPYIVIVVDEFADLILTKEGKDIENSICRLAAKARASGIHIVLATQRPSVDVITGLIKNNFPTRVSFRVTSGQDSKTILTKVGAEKLLGMGDMLYKHGIEMERMHSAFVDENEIDNLVAKLEKIPQSYDSSAIEFLENAEKEEESANLFSGGGSFNDKDASLFEQAVEVVLTHRQASASMLQRRLRIGYNRAATMIEELEAKGIIGPAQGSKPREVMISSLDDLKG